MSIAVRTHNASVAIGDIDPIFKSNGRHAKAADRIGVQLSPLGDGEKVMRMVVMPGDDHVVSSNQGERCEVIPDGMTMTEGDRLQIAWSLLLPADFASPGGNWCSLCDFHNPNAGAAQSPITEGIRDGGDLYGRILAGPENSDHTMGTFRLDPQFGRLERLKWHEMILDIGASGDPAKGGLGFWLDNHELLPFKHMPTLVAGGRNIPVYLKFGHYRSPFGLPGVYWVRDLMMTRNKDTGELRSHFGWMGAPPLPDPTPTPTPTPSTKVKLALSSIQEHDKLPQVSITWKVTTDVPAKSVEFIVNTKTVATVQPSVAATAFLHELDVASLSVGDISVGFKVTNIDGTAGPAFVGFHAEVVATTPTPVPVPTPDVARAIAELTESLLELRASAGYKAAKRDNPNLLAFAATHVGKSETDQLDAIAALHG